MKNLREELKEYLAESLGIEISVHPWIEQKKLPIFLFNAYDFFEASFLNSRCVFMIAKDDLEVTPNTIQKHWEQVTKKCNTSCIYVSNAISGYTRKRLIQSKIPFIIPSNQIYIPDLGIDLSENLKKHRIRKNVFSPSTQVVIISALLGEKNERFLPSELAAKFRYSVTTMTRVFDELEAAGIGKLINKGKERWWIFEGNKRDLWEETNVMLRSPIRSRESMKLCPNCKMMQLPLSGISALAEKTMINPPQLPTYAIGIEEYRDTSILKGLQLSHIDEADLELEIWNYDPKLFSRDERVDPFSLFLSLRSTTDERIESVLEDLMVTKYD